MLRASPRERIRRWAPLSAALAVSIVVVAFFMGGANAESPTTTTTAVVAAPTTETAPATTPPVPPTTSTTAPPDTTTPSITEPPATTSVPGRRGGSVRLGLVGSTPSSLNPLLAESDVVDAIAAMTQGRGWSIDPLTLDPVAELVTELPSFANGGLVLNDDGTVTIRLSIQPEARWSDGVPVTGNDFRETADQLAESSPYTLIDPESWLVGYKTVQFDLVEPTLRWLELFDVVLPSHRVKGTSAFSDWDGDRWPVAGPFEISEVGTEILLTANDEYWKTDPISGAPLPLLDEIIVRVLPTAEDAQTALAVGTVDVAPLGANYEFEPPPSAPELEIATARGDEYEHLAFQLGPTRFDRNPRSLNGSPVYRNLVALLVDRAGIAEEIGAVAPLTSIVGASWPAASGSGWPDEPLSSGQVRAAIDEIEAELGYDFAADPPEVRFNTTNSLERSLVAGVVTQELASGGMFVDVGLEDPGLFFRDFVIAGEFDLALWAWEASPGPLGAFGDLADRFGDPETIGEFNFYGWDAGDSPQAAEVQVALAELGRTMDLDEITAALRRIDELIAADMVVIPLYQGLAGTVYAVDAVGGIDMPNGGLSVTQDAATWFVP